MTSITSHIVADANSNDYIIQIKIKYTPLKRQLTINIKVLPPLPPKTIHQKENMP